MYKNEVLFAIFGFCGSLYSSGACSKMMTASATLFDLSTQYPSVRELSDIHGSCHGTISSRVDVVGHGRRCSDCGQASVPSRTSTKQASPAFFIRVWFGQNLRTSRSKLSSKDSPCMLPPVLAFGSLMYEMLE